MAAGRGVKCAPVQSSPRAARRAAVSAAVRVVSSHSTGCHSPEGAGNPQANFPQLHGQYAAYVEKTLHDFKAGERANDMNAMMRTIAAKLSDAEISAVAEYVSTLK